MVGRGHWRRFGEGSRRAFNRVEAPSPELSLEDAIIAEFADVGWTVPVLLLARSDSVTLVSGKVSVWANLGSGTDATQGSAGLRPTWDATALNSLPALDFHLDRMVTGSIDITSSTAMVQITLFQDSETNTRWVSGLGTAYPSDSGIELLINNAGAGKLEGFMSDGTLTTRASTLASYPMTSPDVVSISWDWNLATTQATIRHSGADVTDIQSASNTAGQTTAETLTIGAGEGGYGPMHNGQISALILADGSSAIPVAAVAAVEALLQAEWGL